MPLEVLLASEQIVLQDISCEEQTKDIKPVTTIRSWRKDSPTWIWQDINPSWEMGSQYYAHRKLRNQGVERLSTMDVC